LHHDTYGGQWGNPADLDTLRSAYLLGATQRQAQLLGWLTELTPAGLVVYHPDGGTLTVSPEGTCETAGFVGAGCHEARLALGLQAVEGSVVETSEACRVPARVTLPVG
jgi:hypothetical protein